MPTLHHFLDANDLAWLKQFKRFDLTDSQQQALVFVREVGAIDNSTYRQMADCDTLKASNDLRLLKTHNLLKSKGKGKATYYVTGGELSAPAKDISTPPWDLSTPPLELSTPPLGLSTPPLGLSTPPLSSLPEEMQTKSKHPVNSLRNFVSEHAWEALGVYYVCQVEHHKRLQTTNMIERVNQELKRRSRVVRIFPNPVSCRRFFTALLKEWHEDWVSGRVYLNMEYLKEFDMKKRLQQQERAPAAEANTMTQKIITVAS